MKSNSMMKAVLAVVLAVSLLATGCSAQWISVALADLPVLTQMALNIAALVATLQSGKQLSAGEAAAIQNISAEASRDLNLLETLYNQYKANPSATGLQKIDDAIATINANLPALLQAAHIGDPMLSARITAAVNLILTTVTSFASLIPQTAAMPKAQRVAAAKIAIPLEKDLKKQWNQQVCGPTGKAELDAAFGVCLVK
ncbi:MAG: hypothetical protein WB421_02955 [Terriglobales bacterium]